MPSLAHTRKLLVEGDTDKRVVPFLVEANGVEWEIAGEPVVYIEPYSGVEELLKPGVIGAEARASGLQATGVVIDANGDAAKRWDQIKSRIRDEFPSLPKMMPKGGLEVDHSDGPRFGIWIMPNNQFSGMSEDFLVQLIPNESKKLFELAQNCVDTAKSNGAPFTDSHRTKAEIHTWLSWQDQPGKQLHQAVHHRVLDPERPESHPFVTWFRNIFRV